MAKKRGGITSAEFAAFIDNGFKNPETLPKRRGGMQPIRLSGEVLERLEREGADPRLTRTGARFNAAIARCMRVPCRPLSEESAAFINQFDQGMRAYAKAAKIDID